MTQLLLLLLYLLPLSSAWSIGANYGMVADNLPPPSQVAQFLKSQTNIHKIKLFDANPDVIKAFSGSGIELTITCPNGDIPGLAQADGARNWVAAYVTPFVPQTNIVRVLVGTEVLHWGPQNIIDNLVPAMRSLHQALLQAGHNSIQVSTPHSLGILARSEPPSTGRFRPGWDVGVLKPMLQFLRETKAPFVVNPYPYFESNPENLNFCLFRTNKGKYDRYTKKMYYSMFDTQMDAVYSAMKALGYADVDIVVGETGWPTKAEDFQTWVNLETAQTYNKRLVMHVDSGKGTPLMPKRKFETYIFSLFVENQKPGPIAEKNFGLFNPDFTPVYDIGVMKNPSKTKPAPAPAASKGGSSPVSSGKWCVPKKEATDAQLQANIDYVCSQQVDCAPIQTGGSCFNPNDIRSHATYAMNTFYQTKGRQPYQCDFSNTAILTNDNPSYGTCKL